MRRAVVLLALPALLALACAGAPRPAPPAGGNDRAAGGTAPATPSAAFPFDELSRGALDLLAESTADSCSICAREAREEALRILDGTIRPGTVLRGGPDRSFVAAPGEENGLLLTSFAHEAIELLFRYHTGASRLVGIAGADLTPDSLAGRPAAALRIVPFDYGDGDAFLWLPAENRLEVMVRPLPGDGAEGRPSLAPGGGGEHD